jgi:hypothetical protein
MWSLVPSVKATTDGMLIFCFSAQNAIDSGDGFSSRKPFTLRYATG